MAIWAAKWQQKGSREHLLHEHGLPVLFKTKREASAWIKERYGYIAKRKDLRTPPHSWRMPKPVEALVFEITHLKALKGKSHDNQ